MNSALHMHWLNWSYLIPTILYIISDFLFIWQDREKIASVLSTVEDWLYGEGEGQKKQIYVDKLAELKVDWILCLFRKTFLDYHSCDDIEHFSS